MNNQYDDNYYIFDEILIPLVLYHDLTNILVSKGSTKVAKTRAAKISFAGLRVCGFSTYKTLFNMGCLRV